MNFEISFPVAAVLVGTIHSLGLINALHALMYARTAQGTLAWILFLAMFPYLGIPLYWIFGPRKFYGYLEVLEKAEQEHREKLEPQLKGTREFEVPLEPELQESERLFELLAEWPITCGNSAELLIDGENTFKAIFSALDNAKDYVLVQFYIVRDDDLGQKLKQRLIDCAHKGVRVYFLFDSIGSMALSKRYIRELTKAGVQILSFRTSRGFWNRFRLNFRNHRKISVVDGKVAFVGGHNVGDEYLGGHEDFGPWRDTHIQVEGPAVQGIQLAFARDWYWATGDVPDMNWKTIASDKGDLKVLPLATGPIGELDSCSLLMLQAIHAAKNRIWITSPYFVPDDAVAQALELAALRGVDVRILLPENPDQLLVYLASFAFFEPMLVAGVRLYRYAPGFLHQKVFLIDDSWGSVGTANLDNRSFRLNFEISVLVFDVDFATGLKEMLTRDFEDSVEVTRASYEERGLLRSAASQLARILAPIL